ncbi:survival motor neuron protein-like isoform X3 [Melanotaenia boesemani]|uniref:survival motor neuron protein-like isoform X3 n=1 Tax=Melanotaenia boesemani TaxID=1250792 RepID=UPI001C04E7EF|nr:survival motor neuron protein-like isoform X3 [Melanotaenia boesemani]
MADIKEHSAFHGAVELEDSLLMPVEEKTSPEKNCETPPEEKSQGIELIQLETSEEMDGNLKLELGDKQQDEQMACPPANDISTSESKDWKPGSRCRAVYSDDGLVYPAVVLWVKGQRCRVRYDIYDNEEEHDVCSLLTPDELHGPSRAAPFKGSNWKSSPTSSNADWKRRRREDKQGERGGERRWRDDQQNSSTNPMSFPSPPPPPPPPPAWVLCGKEAGDSLDVNTITNMLMQWYMCGFQTGTYMAQQLYKSTLKDEVKSPR